MSGAADRSPSDALGDDDAVGLAARVAAGEVGPSELLEAAVARRGAEPDAQRHRPADGLIGFLPFTPLCNMTGRPAVSLPLFRNAANLPVGTHVIGRYGDEAILLRPAAQPERARPWPQPPLRRGAAAGSGTGS